jgi:hypothetical protein
VFPGVAWPPIRSASRSFPPHKCPYPAFDRGAVTVTPGTTWLFVGPGFDLGCCFKNEVRKDPLERITARDPRYCVTRKTSTILLTQPYPELVRRLVFKLYRGSSLSIQTLDAPPSATHRVSGLSRPRLFVGSCSSLCYRLVPFF